MWKQKSFGQRSFSFHRPNSMQLVTLWSQSLTLFLFLLSKTAFNTRLFQSVYLWSHRSSPHCLLKFIHNGKLYVTHWPNVVAGHVTDLCVCRSNNDVGCCCWCGSRKWVKQCVACELWVHAVSYYCYNCWLCILPMFCLCTCMAIVKHVIMLIVAIKIFIIIIKVEGKKCYCICHFFQCQSSLNTQGCSAQQHWFWYFAVLL